MASISARTFIEPRIAWQQGTAIFIDFDTKHEKAAHRVYVLQISDFRMSAVKQHLSGDGSPASQVRLSIKMAAALFVAAKREGYPV